MEHGGKPHLVLCCVLHLIASTMHLPTLEVTYVNCPTNVNVHEEGGHHVIPCSGNLGTMIVQDYILC